MKLSWKMNALTKTTWILGSLLLLLSRLETSEGAKILALLGVASPSHHIFNRALTRALANRGHQVTVISPDQDKDTVPNLTYLHTDGVYEAIHQEMDYESYVDESTPGIIRTMFEWVSFVCESELKTKAAQKLIEYSATEKFDLIITEAGWNECFLGFIPKFGSPPVVAISAYGVVPWASNFMGTPFNPSYIPTSILPFTSHMTFLEKVYNFLIHNLMIYSYKYYFLPTQESLARQYIGLKEDSPSFADIQKNFSILLANTVVGFESAVPLSPNIIPVGGLHIKSKPDPLPKDLKKFLDEAKDGFIFFSLGSNLRSNALPEHKRKALLEAFAELPQRVLWKFESESLPGQPPNVKIGKWLPQSDILAHPNIRMFISHCGKMSSTESTYRGVPMVGIAFFVDQYLNLQLLEERGVAVKLDYHTLTKESVLKAVREVLNNGSYQQNMKKLSQIYKDQPQAALDKAIFWTEYVIRHGGAPHLRPVSTELYLYQYLLLDVVLFLAAISLGLVVAVYFSVRTAFKMFKPKKTDKKKKAN